MSFEGSAVRNALPVTSSVIFWALRVFLERNQDKSDYAKVTRKKPLNHKVNSRHAICQNQKYLTNLPGARANGWERAMGRVIDIKSCKANPDTTVLPWAVDLERFVGSNEDFGRAHLPQIRSAFLTCNCDQLQLTNVVSELAADSVLHEVIAEWRETANYFAELTKALETAIDRVTNVALETERDGQPSH
jgi:hypothetical protein